MARQRAVRAALLTDALWRDLELVMLSSVPTDAEIRALVDRWLKSELDRDKFLRLAKEPDNEGRWWSGAVMERSVSGDFDRLVETLDEASFEAFQALPVEDQIKRLGGNRRLVSPFNELAHERGVRFARHSKANEQHRAGESAAAREVLQAFLDESGLELDPASPAFEQAARTLLRTQKELFDCIAKREISGWRPGFDKDPVQEIVDRLEEPKPALVVAFDKPEVAEVETAPEPHPRLSKMAEEATLSLARSHLWRPGRMDDYRLAVATFIDSLGCDPLVSDVTPRMAGKFQQELGGYPLHPNKRRLYRSLASFQERLAVAKAANEQQVLKPVTINGKYLTPLKVIFDWYERGGSGLPNPFAKTFVKKSVKRDVLAERRDFTPAELQRFFDLPAFTGALTASGSGSARPGTVRIRDWRYWVPLICVFSGMRLNEACGLAIADLKTESGIAYFHVRDATEGQRVKAVASRRKVPVHATLIELGLLEQIELWRDAGRVRLFEELQTSGRGYYSHQPSKQFNAMVKRIAEPEPDEPGKLVFHSTRHTATTRLRAADVRQDVAEEIVGHEHAGVHATYGKFDVPTLKVAIDKIAYPGLDLSRLKVVEAEA
jgi:integrase